MIDPLPDSDSGVLPSRLSRRHLFAAAAAGCGVWALTRVGAVSAEGAVSELTAPGVALEQAARIPPTTVLEPPPPFEPPPDGQLLFPILVGEQDDCYVLDNFGDCRGSGCSRSHEGVDIMADQGLTIVASADGELTKQYVDSGLSYGAGHGWTLDGDDGVVYKYFHLDSHESGLEEGDRVLQGQVIGYVGNTGTSGIHSDSNHHLHFEYRPDNVPANSFSILVRAPFVDFEGE
jgi:murein DD-endopeptidase MepM/ murein hydrolase activator NlpD